MSAIDEVATLIREARHDTIAGRVAMGVFAASMIGLAVMLPIPIPAKALLSLAVLSGLQLADSYCRLVVANAENSVRTHSLTADDNRTAIIEALADVEDIRKAAGWGQSDIVTLHAIIVNLTTLVAELTFPDRTADAPAGDPADDRDRPHDLSDATH